MTNIKPIIITKIIVCMARMKIKNIYSTYFTIQKLTDGIIITEWTLYIVNYSTLNLEMFYYQGNILL